MTHSGSYFAGNASPGIAPGSVLADRYQIVNVLGQGGFGRTYLATDRNRFNEYCVLKEFAPQVQDPDHLQKAYDLFEREAGVLYRLNHNQIPCFRELLRTRYNNRGYLLLGQDYVQGQTYRDLLIDRQRQGGTFSESEVSQLLGQLLPVLAYIHANGVIHRDISTDNLMRRESDGLPILIDFGGVKQAAASVMSQFSQMAPASLESTRLGKLGYAPAEQLQQGLVYPHSDLYALGVTAVVLLTGQEPQTLIDPHTLEWRWRSWVTVSPTLGQVLDRMLAYRPSDRYPSATAVLLAINGVSPEMGMHPSQPAGGSNIPHSPPPTAATIAVAGAFSHTTGTGYPPNPQASPASATRLASGENPPQLSPSSNSSPLPWGTILAFLGFVLAVGASSWWGFRSASLSNNTTNPANNPSPQSGEPVSPATPAPTLPPVEWQRNEGLLQRARELGIPPAFFQSLVDSEFYAQYPELGGRALTTDPQDASYREDWSRVAQTWLDRLQPLPKEWRSSLGQYTGADYQTWVNALGAQKISKSAFVDLVDNQFSGWFPDQPLEGLTENNPLLAAWYTMAATVQTTVLSGDARQDLYVNPNSTTGSVRRSLPPRKGLIYTANLQTGDRLRVTLSPDDDNFRWSIYSPSGAEIRRQSQDYFWESTLTEAGPYQFVILAGNQQADFSLDMIAEPPSPVPTPTAIPSPTGETIVPPTEGNPTSPDSPTPDPQADPTLNDGTLNNQPNNGQGNGNRGRGKDKD